MTSIQRHKAGELIAKGRPGIRRANQKRDHWGYLIMWEFRVRTGMKNRFEKVYGSDGDWVRLFQQIESYIGTELIHNLKIDDLKDDLKKVRTYVTLDFWTSQEAYNEFRRQHLAEYKALDRKCQEMTESEREIGRFVRVRSELGSAPRGGPLR